MNSPFVWFLCFCAVIGSLFFWFTRGIIFQLSKQAAHNASMYAPAYAKGGALMAIAAGTSFIEIAEKLSTDVAAILPWWSWLALFVKPIIAALAVYVAFVDRTMEKLRADRDFPASPK